MHARDRAISHSRISLGLLATFFTFAGSGAWSQALPQANVGLDTTILYPTPPYETNTESSSFGSITSPDGVATASALLGADPSAYFSAGSVGLESSTSSVHYSYFFEILAPGGAEDPATVTVNSVLQDVSPAPQSSPTASSIADGFSTLQILFYNSPNTVVGSWESPVNASGFPVTGTTDVNQILSLYTGVVYQVTVGGNAQSNVAGDSGIASVDPIIALDPADPNSSLYTLEFSSGVTSPVPIPSAAWLMLAGLGGLGVMLRATKPAVV